MPWRNILIVAALVVVGGCASKRPVLYPNDQLQRVGAAAAERDISACTQRAEQYAEGRGSGAGDVARDTAIGAGTGAAIGAAGGAVAGHAGRGAAVGAASGGTAGLLHGIFGVFGKREPDPVQRAFVERCLQESGYDVIGWR